MNMIQGLISTMLLSASLYSSEPLTVKQFVEQKGVYREYKDAQGNISASGMIYPISHDIDLRTVTPRREIWSLQKRLTETHIMLRKIKRMKEEYVVVQAMEIVDRDSNEQFDPSIDTIIMQDISQPLREITDVEHCQQIFQDAYELVRLRLELPSKEAPVPNLNSKQPSRPKPSYSSSPYNIRA